MNASPLQPPPGKVETLRFAPNQCVFRQGERGNCAYLVHTGRILIRQNVDGHLLQVEEIGPGQLFGEMSLLGAERRTSTAVAAEDCIVSRIPTPTFHRTLDDADRFVRAFVTMVMNNIRESHRYFLRRPRSLRDHLLQMKTFSENIRRFSAVLDDAALAREMTGTLGRLDAALAELGTLVARCPDKRHDIVLHPDELRGIGLDKVVGTESRRRVLWYRQDEDAPLD
ncbi:MAG: cyclic nucleotide-binding domain-containing protein [Magnetospirillum sp.]|nr:cyclic nucleotide-binding domain-containing protein [Magnetospirillum sp.]